VPDFPRLDRNICSPAGLLENEAEAGAEQCKIAMLFIPQQQF